MIRFGLLLPLALMIAGAGCTSDTGARPGDGAAAAGGTLGGGGGGAGTLGSGGAPGGGGSSCPCASDLAVDVDGDGARLHLTSADFAAGGRSDLPTANLFSALSVTTLAACLTDPRPWAESTSGQGSMVYWVQACAGPGSAPPCVWLNANAVNPSVLGSLYVDRSGQSIRGYVQALSSSFRAFQSPLSETIEGTFSMALEDGRTLTADFRVCLLANVNFP